MQRTERVRTSLVARGERENGTDTKTSEPVAECAEIKTYSGFRRCVAEQYWILRQLDSGSD